MLCTVNFLEVKQVLVNFLARRKVMRKILLMVVVFGLLINSAFAKLNSNEEKTLIDALHVLTGKSGDFKEYSEVCLNAMNLALKNLEAKFTVKKAVEYKDNQIKGVRYLIKNVSKEAIYVRDQFAKSDNLLALMFDNNILFPNETGIVCIVHKLG